VSLSMVELTSDAESNGLAGMMAELVRQNVADHPAKASALQQIRGRFAIVAEDSNVATTLWFHDGVLTVCGGIVGIPDITLRGVSDDLMRLSLLEKRTIKPLSIEIPDPAGENFRALVTAIRERKLKVYGAMAHPLLFVRVGDLLSVS
jgi:hypothetical protein